MKYEAVLFDMNGVLVDDEILQEEAFREALKQEGHKLTPKQYKEHFAGRTDREGLESYFQKKAEDVIKQSMGAKKKAYKALAASGVSTFEGVQDFVRTAAMNGLKLAVVTSSTRDETEKALASTDLSSFFSKLITAEDITIGKPNPEGYLKAASELHVDPKVCLVIEDAPSGIAAAKKAGMYCIAVTNTHIESELTEADSIVSRLDIHLIQD